jgi:gamma-glutamyl hercynylcysteine S-oxide synthase
MTAVQTPSAPSAALRQGLLARLAGARERTLLLIEPLTDADLTAQHDPLLSPIVWDLGHIARFEELWLLRQVAGPIAFGEMPGLFNPFEHPRKERGALELPGRRETLATLADVRERVKARLLAGDIEDSELTRDGYVWRMVAQHEEQHQETMLQTLQLKTGAPYAPALRVPPPPPTRRVDPGTMVRFPGGTVTIGTDDRAAAYDNERPRHEIALAPFLIDAAPVSNGDYLAFIADGGYRDARWWSKAGRRWREESGAKAPMYWERRGGDWWTRSMDRSAPVDPNHPVCHVSWHEAEAYARWAGKRLPTELEWEAAATWDPEAGAVHRYPWGDEAPNGARANVDQLVFGTAPIGAYAANVSPIGCYGMIGDVWEWTSSDFGPYPGFRSFPYPEYSEVFFGSDYKVLRGGSWATRPGVARGTFRNWDYPVRRQIFSGFRCARDV